MCVYLRLSVLACVCRSVKGAQKKDAARAQKGAAAATAAAAAAEATEEGGKEEDEEEEEGLEAYEKGPRRKAKVRLLSPLHFAQARYLASHNSEQRGAELRRGLHL